MTTWPQKKNEILTWMHQAGDTPVTKAWEVAFEARGEVEMAGQASGLQAAVEKDDWKRSRRALPEVRERLMVLVHLSDAVYGLGEGDLEWFGAALKRYLEMQVPLERLEHIELHAVLALMKEQPIPEGARVQLSWRGVAAGTLGWALGVYDDWEEMEDTYLEMSSGMEGRDPALPFHRERPRSQEHLNEALERLSADLANMADSSLRSIRIEEVKALRWLLEPWWPELALTPWRTNDSLSPKTLEEFREHAWIARTQMLAEHPDPSIRGASEVADMAVSLLLHGSYLPHAVLKRETVREMLTIAMATGVSPTDPLAKRGVAAGMAYLEATPGPDEADLRRCIWLSAGADALFWALGIIVDLPEGDPPEVEYLPLHGVLGSPGWSALSVAAGLRPKYLIEREWTRWNRVRLAADPGTEPFSFGLERCRALRWILEAWPSVSETPWDDSNTVTPYEPAPL